MLFTSAAYLHFEKEIDFSVLRFDHSQSKEGSSFFLITITIQTLFKEKSQFKENSSVFGTRRQKWRGKGEKKKEKEDSFLFLVGF